METVDGLDIFSLQGNVAGRPQRYRMVACEVAHRECCYTAAISRNIIDLHFLTQGLHDVQNTTMCERIQAAIDATPAGRYDAIILGYGLCNGGLAGVTARDIPLVLPRAHDCITLFLGSKERYQEYFQDNPGTYYLSTGWVERDKDNLENTLGDQDNHLHKMGLDQTFQQYVELYGEEHAKMIMSTIGGLDHYSKMTHIDMGVSAGSEKNVQQATQQEAERRGWAFERLSGKLDLFLALAEGGWDAQRFLVVPPGHRIEQAYNDEIIRAVPA